MTILVMVFSIFKYFLSIASVTSPRTSFFINKMKIGITDAMRNRKTSNYNVKNGTKKVQYQ